MQRKQGEGEKEICLLHGKQPMFESSNCGLLKHLLQVELDRTGGPIGITLATDEGDSKGSKVGPIVISRLMAFLL